MSDETTNQEEHQDVVQIDEHRLDKECINLPSTYLRWANRVADLKADHDEAKAELEVVDADLARRIRDTPGKYGMEKVTENGIESTTLVQQSHRLAADKLRKLKHELSLGEAVVSALEIKKRSLTLLVDLHGMGYFSEVRPKTAEGRDSVREANYRKVKPLQRRSREDD